MKKMKKWLKYVIWLILFFFFSIFKSTSSYSTSLAPRSSALSPSDLPSNRPKTVLVATLDGTLSLVEMDSLKIVWSIKTGLPIYSSYQASQNLDVNLETASGHGDDIFIDIGDDWNLYKHDKGKGIMERLKSAKDLMRETKGLSKNGSTVIGQMATTVFVVDAKTGTVIRTVRFSDSTGLGFENTENPIMIRGESKEQISITRTDYSFLAYSKLTGKVLWNVSLAEFEAESFCLEVETSKVVDLQDELRFVHKADKSASCLRPTIVYRIRDRGYSELISGSGLINDEPKTLPGERVLPLPAPDHLYFHEPVGEIFGAENDSIPALALPSPESSIPVHHSEVLALPSASYDSGTTMYPESNGSHFLVLPILSSLFFLVSVGYGVYRSIVVREKTQSEDVKMRISTPKKKKSRKGGNNKNIGTVDNTKGRISLASDGGLGGSSHLQGLNKNSESSFSGLCNVSVNERQIGKLCVSNTEIGKGSNGTVVFEGKYDGRPVAVKRLVRTHHDVALKEMQNLMASDHNPNIVRFYGVEQDSDFVYLSLERCLCTLNDLITVCSEHSQGATSTKNAGSNFVHSAQLLEYVGSDEDFKLWKADGYPSPHLLKLMRDVVSGVSQLHELGFIHRDLKPQNVLIIKERIFCAKLSDMGISKRLVGDVSSLTQQSTGAGSSGWRSPEQILDGRQTRAVDLFSLGCILFFCMTGGKHPFGDNFERDANVVKNRKDLFPVDHVPEAVDLITHLLDPNPDLRPKAAEILHHPLFWNSEKRLSFLRDASDRVELEDREQNSVLLEALEATAPIAVGGKWDEKLEPSFLTNITRYRRYRYDSVRDMLRVIRNKLNHYRELPFEIQEVLGSVPEGFDNYFTVRFPKLLIEVYRVIYDKCQEEELFRKYFKNSLL